MLEDSIIEQIRRKEDEVRRRLERSIPSREKGPPDDYQAEDDSYTPKPDDGSGNGYKIQ
jgi:hypothetical protein